MLSAMSASYRLLRALLVSRLYSARVSRPVAMGLRVGRGGALRTAREDLAADTGATLPYVGGDLVAEGHGFACGGLPNEILLARVGEPVAGLRRVVADGFAQLLTAPAGLHGQGCRAVAGLPSRRGYRGRLRACCRSSVVSISSGQFLSSLVGSYAKIGLSAAPNPVRE